MKSIIALAIAMPFLTPSAHAYALETQTYTCKNYLRTERVVPGHYDKGGNWVSARIIQSNRAVPCDMPHATHVSHGYHQQNNYYPQQYPQHQQQPLIINNQPPAQRGVDVINLLAWDSVLAVEVSLVIISVVVKSLVILLETLPLALSQVESLDASCLVSVPVT